MQGILSAPEVNQDLQGIIGRRLECDVVILQKATYEDVLLLLRNTAPTFAITFATTYYSCMLLQHLFKMKLIFTKFGKPGHIPINARLSLESGGATSPNVHGGNRH